MVARTARHALIERNAEVIKIIQGNKAKLVDSETCQRCGQCCKEFTVNDNLDFSLRFMWLDTRKIKAEDTPFGHKKTTFKFPCTQLEHRNGKYSCKRYGQERPNFCATYPDHIFYEVEIWNTQKIEKLLEDERKDCPGLKKVTVQDVVKMLDER